MAEGEEPLQRRICFDGKKRGNPLLTPCSCKGSSKYVHRKCLEAYRRVEPTKGLYCTVCKEKLATAATVKQEALPDLDFLWDRILLHPYIAFVVLNYLTFFVGKETWFLQVSNGTVAALYPIAVASNTWVQNHSLVWKHWNTQETWILVGAHLATVSCWPFSPALSSIVNLFLVSIYYHKHCYIVQKINDSAQVRFTSRTR